MRSLSHRFKVNMKTAFKPLITWRPGAKEMNEVGLMVGTNLGIGEPVVPVPTHLLVMNYLHPLLFVVPFVPWVVRNWRTIDVL